MKGRTVAIAVVAALGLGAAAQAQERCEGVQRPGASKLVVQMSGIRPASGEVAVTVYPDSKKRFLAPGGKLARERVKVTGAAARACFWLPAGNYAVAVYHDRNGDRDFNRTLVGLPAEGFGFSNNPETKFGLPPLEAARFSLSGERTLSVQMRYLR